MVRHNECDHIMADNLKKNWDFGWGLRLWQRWERLGNGEFVHIFHKFDKDWVKACQLFQIAFKRGGLETSRHIVLRGYASVTGEWWNQYQLFRGHGVTSDLCKNRLNTLNWIVNNYSNSQIKEISWWNVKSEFGREVLAGKRGKLLKIKAIKYLIVNVIWLFQSPSTVFHQISCNSILEHVV